MKLKERDKNLLFIVACVVIIACAWFFGFNNITAKTEEIRTEADKLELELTNLRMLAAQKDKFIADTQTYVSDTATRFDKYDTGYSQEYSIKFIEGIQKQTGVWIKSAALNATQPVFTFGQVTSSNPDRPGQLVHTSDKVGFSTNITMSYQGEYDQVKNMIDYINGYKYKCIINSITTSYNSDAMLVSGNISMTIFAITGADREFIEPSISNPFFGTDNIFDSPIFEAGSSENNNGDHILTDYDLYCSIQAANSDMEALEIGLKDDVTGYSKVVDEDNSSKDVTIRVTGEDGKYSISYKVGNVTFPVASYNDGEPIQAGNELSMLVLSAERISVDDLSAAEVSIINESDQIFYVKVVNEDLNNPRFNVKYKSGEVVIYEDK